MACDLGNSPRGAPGKLKAVARRWVEIRQGGRDELDDDFRAFDLADQIDTARHEPTGIWLENALTARVFFDQENQWLEKMTAHGTILQGLDHGQIKHTLELLCVKRREWSKIFNGLKVMETAALEAMNHE